MPRLVDVPGYLLAALRVSQQEAVLPAVLREPLSLRSFTVALPERGDIHCKPGLVLGVPRLSRVGISDFCSVDGSPVRKGSLLLLVGAEAGNYRHVVSGSLAHFQVRAVGLVREAVAVILRQVELTVDDYHAADGGNSVRLDRRRSLYLGLHRTLAYDIGKVVHYLEGSQTEHVSALIHAERASLGEHAVLLYLYFSGDGSHSALARSEIPLDVYCAACGYFQRAVYYQLRAALYVELAALLYVQRGTLRNYTAVGNNECAAQILPAGEQHRGIRRLCHYQRNSSRYKRKRRQKHSQHGDCLFCHAHIVLLAREPSAHLPLYIIRHISE